MTWVAANSDKVPSRPNVRIRHPDTDVRRESRPSDRRSECPPRHGCNIPVGRNGVERVRLGLNHSRPPTTRVVVYLDSVHPVTVEASDRKVSLNILPALTKWAHAEARVLNERKEGNANIVEVSATTSLEPSLAPRAAPVAAQQGASPPATVGLKTKGIADTTPTADSLTTTGSGVAASDLGRSSEPSRLRWILPILTTSIILAMLVIALVNHIQNKRLRRGL
jgi:hypothetical protein